MLQGLDVSWCENCALEPLISTIATWRPDSTKKARAINPGYPQSR